MKEFIDNLKRDKARGDLAPHQIILLLSLHKLYSENKSNLIEIEDLINTFSLIWKEYQGSFKTKNCNLGMPLKVFVNKDYIKIKITDEINDFRSKIELQLKITEIQVNQILVTLFKNSGFRKYLETRFYF